MRLALVLSVLLPIAGCASVDSSPTEGRALAAYRGEVRVLPRLPRGSYEHLGVVLVRGVNLTSDERMLARLKAEAAARGANAVVLQTKDVLERPTETGGVERRLAAWALRLPESQ